MSQPVSLAVNAWAFNMHTLTHAREADELSEKIINYAVFVFSHSARAVITAELICMTQDDYMQISLVDSEVDDVNGWLWLAFFVKTFFPVRGLIGNCPIRVTTQKAKRPVL